LIASSARRDQPALVRLLLDDPAVILDVRRGGHRALHRSELRATTHPIEQAHGLQLRRESDVVDRLTRGEEVERRPVDLAVVLAIEVFGVQELQDLGDRKRVEQYRSDDRHLGVKVVGGHPPLNERNRGRH